MTAPSEREVFESALSLAGSARVAHVRDACAGDDVLAARVMALLAAHERGEARADREVLRSPLDDPETIGPYRVIERIGAGGMGVVYLAEQRQPIQRRVAVKVVRAGMLTEDVLARFYGERRTLARMDHPGIARIYDSGATDQGLPYFVMEYVPGEPLLAWCDRRALSIAERLELFAQVCLAVQHAHQKGIIHRDIKPSNVLVVEVDGQPVPKVIDFGIAKAIDPTEEDGAVRTRTGGLVGTPAYMSPEQISGGSALVDTRADVYSLGVVLYELLTGMAIFDAATQASGLDELRRLVLEVDPVRPSRRVGTSNRDRAESVAQARGLSSTRLVSSLRGDLDQVVGKALEKEPARRYETAGNLARDIERFLANEPVQATPPSGLYVARKFVARHRVLVVATGLVALALVLGTIGTSVGLVKASREQARAEARANEAAQSAARAVAARDYLTTMIANANPMMSLRKDLKVSDLLSEASARLDDGEFADDPDTKFILRFTLGDAFRSVDRYPEALYNLQNADELLAELPDVERLEVVRLHVEIGSTLHDLSRYAEADLYAHSALAELDELGIADHTFRSQALSLLAMQRYSEADFDEAVRLAREAVDVRERFDGGLSEDSARLRTSLAFFLAQNSAYDASREQLERALALQRTGTPRARIDAADSLRQRAMVNKLQGRLSSAADDLVEALAIRKGLFDDASLPVADILHDLAGIELQRNNTDIGYEYAQHALELRRSMLGTHRDLATALTTYAEALTKRGDLNGALAAVEESLVMRQELFGAEGIAVADSLARMGALQRRLGNLDASAKQLNSALDIWTRNLGPEATDVARAHLSLAQTYAAGRKLEEAWSHADQALPIWIKQFGVNSPKARENRDLLITLAIDRQDWIAAETLIRSAIDQLPPPGGKSDLLRAYLSGQLGAALAGQAKLEEGEELLLHAWGELGENPKIWAVNKLFLLDHLVKLYEQQSAEAEAAKYRALADGLREK